MNNIRRTGAIAAGAVATVVVAVTVVAVSAAWACIAGPTLNLNPAQVKPGQEVALSGFSYNGERPIVVRFNALDGPVLGTFQPVEGRFGDPEFLRGTVKIPADTKPGSYVLIAAQYAADGSLASVPVRALVTVTSSGGAPAVGAPTIAVEAGRSVGLMEHESSTNLAALILVGLAAAVIAGLAAWVLAVGPVRRSGAAEPVRTA
jgi:hypothetical protein